MSRRNFSEFSVIFQRVHYSLAHTTYVRTTYVHTYRMVIRHSPVPYTDALRIPHHAQWCRFILTAKPPQCGVCIAIVSTSSRRLSPSCAAAIHSSATKFFLLFTIYFLLLAWIGSESTAKHMWLLLCVRRIVSNSYR